MADLEHKHFIAEIRSICYVDVGVLEILPYQNPLPPRRYILQLLSNIPSSEVHLIVKHCLKTL